MTAPDILLFLLGLVLILGFLFWLPKWASFRLANRALAKVLDPDTPKARLMPESQFIIKVTEKSVTCHRPDGTTESVTWDDLQKVDIFTNSDGPLLPDVFLILHGTNKGCVIPQGATGQSKLLDRLQALPGFDNRALIDAMGSTQEATFCCWMKTPAR
ncbi:MAG: hypothetical protein U1F71_12510 [Verrucomicrobiaceae bacterium]